MVYQYDSYCGLYCGACDGLQVTKTGKIEIAAKKWKMNPADITCHGCKSSIISIYCKECDIRKCAQQRKVEFCFECKKFPCKRISAFNNDKYPHHSIVLKNLNTIKEKGMKSWLRAQDRRWRCKKCRTRFVWYTKKCDKCGALVYNSILEEKTLN